VFGGQWVWQWNVQYKAQSYPETGVTGWFLNGDDISCQSHSTRRFGVLTLRWLCRLGILTVQVPKKCGNMGNRVSHDHAWNWRIPLSVWLSASTSRLRLILSLLSFHSTIHRASQSRLQYLYSLTILPQVNPTPTDGDAAKNIDNTNYVERG
jgi:hypothetical protein